MGKWIDESFFFIRSALKEINKFFWVGGFLLNFANFIWSICSSKNQEITPWQVYRIMPWHFWVIFWLGVSFFAVVRYGVKQNRQIARLKSARSKKETPLQIFKAFLSKKYTQGKSYEKDGKHLLRFGHWANNTGLGIKTGIGKEAEETFKDCNPERPKDKWLWKAAGFSDKGDYYISHIGEYLEHIGELKENTTSGDLTERFIQHPEDIQEFEEDECL